MNLNELIDIDDLQERNRQIRRAFAPYSESLDVDGNEQLALVIMVNLTYKKLVVADLCDIKLARSTFKNKAYLEKCIKTVKWQHSHNLKYPDSRVSDQRLLISSPVPVPGCATSAGESFLLGWSHNSADVNLAKLFCSFIRWRGEVTNLALLLSNNESVWCQALTGLGGTDKIGEEIKIRLAGYLPDLAVPNEVSPYSTQVRMPFQNSYCSVTPVVSHALQCKVQRLSFSKKLVSITTNHGHSASVGDLAASLGGRVRVLSSTPAVKNVRNKTYTNSIEKRLQNERGVLARSAITNSDFLLILKSIIHRTVFSSEKERNVKRSAALKGIRKALLVWMEPLQEWRDEVIEKGVVPEGLELESFEYQFLTLKQDELVSLVSKATIRFHEALQYHRSSQELAFHPELIKPVRAQLKWLLAQTAGESKCPKVDDSKGRTYLHLSGLRVHDALAMSTPYLYGIPSLTALWGLNHNFERRLKKLLGRDIGVVGTAWFIQNYSQTSQSKLPEPSILIKTKEQISVKRPGILNFKYCDLTMDLVVIIQSKVDEILLDSTDLPAIQAAFPSRFSGGCLHPPQLSEKIDWCRLYQNKNYLFSVLSRLPSNGCWVYPVETPAYSLDGLIQELKDDPGYRLASIGYVALEDPCQRENSIEDKHCFAEPALGLVNCVNPIETRFAGEQAFFNNAFWQVSIKNRSMLIKKALV